MFIFLYLGYSCEDKEKQARCKAQGVRHEVQGARHESLDADSNKFELPAMGNMVPEGSKPVAPV
jgi:hypothetical protein